MHARNACSGSAERAPRPGSTPGFGCSSVGGGSVGGGSVGGDLVSPVAGASVVVVTGSAWPPSGAAAVVVGATVVPASPSLHTVVDVAVPPSLPAWRGRAITAAGSARVAPPTA